MTELLKELEAVVDVAEKATPGPFFVDAYGDVQANGEDVARIASSGDLANNDARVVAAAVNFLRTHHAEIAEALRDARRYRYVCENLMTDRAGMFEVQQCIDLTTTECYMSKQSVDEAVDAAIDAHNSAREVGE